MANGTSGPASAAPTKAPELSIVIPVHNEAANIAALIAEIVSVLRGRLSFEVIAVNDASTDATGAELTEIADTIPELRILSHARQAGQSAALITGVRAARAAWIATLDGDGQNDPADIPELLKVRDQESEPGGLLIAGHRASRRDTASKRFQSRIANRVRARLLGDDTPDTGCGLKVFEREVFLSIPHFDHVHRFLPALFIRQGGKVISHEVTHRPRGGGSSHYGMWGRLTAGLVDLVGVMWLQRRKVVIDAEEQAAKSEDRGQ